MIPISFLNLFLYFAFIYITGRNTQHITSDFLFMGDHMGFLFSSSCSRFQFFHNEYGFHYKNTTFLKYVSVVLRCQSDWKIKMSVIECLGNTNFIRLSSPVSAGRYHHWARAWGGGSLVRVTRHWGGWRDRLTLAPSLSKWDLHLLGQVMCWGYTEPPHQPQAGTLL